MEKGKIIYLEGVSSSGKTTLAKTLQNRLSEPYFWLASDIFLGMAPIKFQNDMELMYPKIESSLINTVKLFSEINLNVIVDIVHIGKVRNNFVKALHEFPVMYVNVTCPLEELRRREKERENADPRKIGTAESQIQGLPPQGTYDIIVNTHENSSEECADKIIEMLNQLEKCKAFKTLWAQCSK
ncbi:MAG: chloramphenicol phosphotransferase CPT family protein [Oscillospiraceae bacterium]|nr:chloramphenicol phosphotransferase CPT family protein [Oscillospiraceae bacterium]